MQVPLIRLQCGVNSYDWGKVGKESAAAKFAAATASDFSIQENKPYAEVYLALQRLEITNHWVQLWMGTHPSNPSKDVLTKRTLLELVQDNQALLGQDVGQRYGQKLPFLFKVLSIGKALSIQAHPNKKLAEQLHKKDSKNYPDDNHKPEMTIAITPFEGFCGFRPLKEIAHFLDEVPALRKLVGESEAAEFQSAVKGQHETEKPEEEEQNKKALQKVFAALMNAKKEAIEEAAKELVECAEREKHSFAGDGGPSNSGSELSDLVIRLNSQFPHDIGLFVLFFLNYVKLEGVSLSYSPTLFSPLSRTQTKPSPKSAKPCSSKPTTSTPTSAAT
jgi:mannose-6-phosphate isomerase